MGDHPVIHNIETTGYPDGNEPVYPKCPVCGSEPEIFYKNVCTGEIVGCEDCLGKVRADEMEEI